MVLSTEDRYAIKSLPESKIWRKTLAENVSW